MRRLGICSHILPHFCCRYVGEQSQPGFTSEILSHTARNVSNTSTSSEPEIRHRMHYTVVEDRSVVKERVTRILEHWPVEKQYEITLKQVYYM